MTPDATLTTTGRRSGEPREVRIYAFPDGDEGGLILIGCGSAAGSPVPAWVHNLRVEPRCTLRPGKGRTGDVRAGVAHEVPPGPERDRLWELAVAAFPYYEAYQRKAAHPIPVFVFEADPTGR